MCHFSGLNKQTNNKKGSVHWFEYELSTNRPRPRKHRSPVHRLHLRTWSFHIPSWCQPHQQLLLLSISFNAKHFMNRCILFLVQIAHLQNTKTARERSGDTCDIPQTSDESLPQVDTRIQTYITYRPGSLWFHRGPLIYQVFLEQLVL